MRHMAAAWNAVVWPWLWSAVLVLMLARGRAEFPPSPASYDLEQDWYSNITAKGANGCFIPPRRSTAPFPTCSSTAKSNRTAVEIQQLGWKLAPVLYMHPNETSHLADPSSWIRQMPIYSPLNYSIHSLGDPMLSLSSQSGAPAVIGSTYFTTHLYDNITTNTFIPPISTEELKNRTLGDAILNGRSTAKVFYTSQDASDDPSFRGMFLPNRVVTFTFHYFYPFNGCSNQLFAMNIRGKYQGDEYYMCPTGVHEGDWEHLSMWVCVNDWTDEDPASAIMRVQYSTHSWNSQYDCKKDECVFEDVADEAVPRRLVAYAGLFSHAMYPVPSPLIVYQKVSAKLLLNVDGVYIGDRTARGGAVFMPDADNTIFLPFADEMTSSERQEFDWALFTGSWGGYTTDTGDQMSITCFSNNMTQMGACPDRNPATQFLLGALAQRYTITPEANLTWQCTINSDGISSSSALTGPLMRDYTYMWQPSSQPPIWDDDSQISKIGKPPSCPFAGDPDATSATDEPLQQYKLASFLVALVSLLVGSGVVFGIALFWPKLQSERQLCEMLTSFRTSSHLAPDSIGMTKEYVATRHLIWMAIGAAAYVCGVVLAVLGTRDVFRALDNVYHLPLYDTLEKTLKIILTLFGAVQVFVALCVVVLRSHHLLRVLCCLVRNPLRRWRAANKTGWHMQAVLACLQVIAINTTLLFFAFGFTMTVIRIVAQNACGSVLSRLFDISFLVSDVCLDLNTFGIDKTICGSNLTQICSIWYGLHTEYLAYGGLLLILSHLLFLSMSVHQYVSLRSLQAVVEMLRNSSCLPLGLTANIAAGASPDAKEPIIEPFVEQASDNTSHGSPSRTPTMVDADVPVGSSARLLAASWRLQSMNE